MGCGLCGAVLGAECSSAEARGWYLPLCVGFFGTSKGIKRDSELRWDGQERQERLQIIFALQCGTLVSVCGSWSRSDRNA